MAITPRTILTSAAPATVAVISLYVFTALGTMAYKSGRDIENDRDFRPSNQVVSTIHVSGDGQQCSEIPEAFGSDKREWSERAWVTYAVCFDYQKDSSMVVSTAKQGLKYYPQSEVLYNLAGYHQIVLGEHEEAVKTLRLGMRNVSGFQSGIMPNNLAWAGMWTSRTMPLDEARTLYQQSLALSPDSCETIHTALWVEYASTRNTTGVDRIQAFNRFQGLRQMYEPCMSRVDSADWNTLVEIVGATTIIKDIDQQQYGTNQTNVASVHATKMLLNNHRNASFDDICAEAMPLSETHQKCVTHLQNNVEHLHHNRLIRHNRAERSHSPHHAKGTHCGGINR